MPKQNTSPSRQKAESTASPGPLRGDANLVIQTRQAQRLIDGRLPSAGGKPFIPGLFHFATAAGRIWGAAALDDPWGDWFLLRLEDGLRTAREDVRSSRERVATQWEGISIDVEIARSVQPMRIPLGFSTPYGFMAAYLCADFDALACAVLTARHVGLLAREDAERTLRQAVRSVRRAFLLASRYRQLGVTRDEMGTTAAQSARTAMGDPPAEVLAGMWRAEHAPRITRVAPKAKQDSGPGNHA